MVSKMAEGAAGKSATPNITDAGLLELETIHKNLLTKGRPLNADGGRVGMWKGGMPRGLMAALKTIRGKFGKGAIHQADEVVVDGDVYKISDKDRPPTDYEMEEYAGILDPTGETGIDAITIRQLDEAVADRNAYEAEMMAEYKAGRLDKYAPSLADEVNDAQIRAAVDDIFPTGDYKYDAEMAAEALVENNPQIFGNKLLDDLDQRTQTKIYGLVLEVVQGDMGKMLQMKRLSKPTKTLEGIEKTGTINISDDAVAEEFSRFMKESDPTGFKDLEQKVELSNFNPKGRKKNAHGGIINLTNNPMTVSSKAGVESLFERR